MKKILLIVPSLHQGGLEKVCAYTAKLLQPCFDVRVAFFDSENVAYDIGDIPITDIGLPSKPGKIAKLTNVIKRGIKLRRLIREEKPDIAYSFGPTANKALFMSFAKVEKWFGIRSYMDMGYPRQIKLFCRFSDRLICCSETICNEICEKYHCDHAYTLHNPFDIAEVERLADAKKPDLPWEEGRILVSMGREDVVKGFFHLLRIFRTVHESLPDTRLVIVGKGEFTEYKKLAQELGIGEVVYFAGMQKNPYPYLKAASLYLLTSYYEGFPNALVEAMSLGKAVIATDCMTGPSEILEDRYGVLVPNLSKEPDFGTNISEEEEKYAKLVVELLSDEVRLAKYGALAKQRAAMYSKEKYVGQIQEWAKEKA